MTDDREEVLARYRALTARPSAVVGTVTRAVSVQDILDQLREYVYAAMAKTKREVSVEMVEMKSEQERIFALLTKVIGMLEVATIRLNAIEQERIHE